MSSGISVSANSTADTPRSSRVFLLGRQLMKDPLVPETVRLPRYEPPTVAVAVTGAVLTGRRQR
jgi:hypothetical protein